MAKVLPKIGFSLYPDEPAFVETVDPAKMFDPRSLFTAPTPAPPKQPEPQVSSAVQTLIDKVRELDMRLDPQDIEELNDRLSRIEKRVFAADYDDGGVEERKSQNDDVAEVHARIDELWEAVNDLTENLKDARSKLWEAVNDLTENVKDARSKLSTIETAVFQNPFSIFEATSDALTQQPSFEFEHAIMDEEDDDEEEEEEIKHKEDNVRVIEVPAVKSTTTKLSRADVIEKLHGKSEKDLMTKLKVQDLTDMLGAFNKTYVPPKLDGVRLLHKLVNAQ